MLNNVHTFVMHSCLSNLLGWVHISSFPWVSKWSRHTCARKSWTSVSAKHKLSLASIYYDLSRLPCKFQWRSGSTWSCHSTRTCLSMKFSTITRHSSTTPTPNLHHSPEIFAFMQEGNTGILSAAFTTAAHYKREQLRGYLPEYMGSRASKSP